ncbi:MAG: hypothetical protein RDU20_06185 [Desulfomonilaceae bacterium]|nr:hypothetical protein [Desulfomonilaceae bacterium]
MVEDIRSGMSRSRLTEKYVLTPEALEELLSVLADVNAVSEDEIFGDFYFPCTDSPERSTRNYSRYRVDFDAPIYNAIHPELHGNVRDITLMGVSTEGLGASVDDVMDLVILGDPCGEVVPIEFEAICRWTGSDSANGTFLAGFQVTRITRNNLIELKKFIHLLDGDA